MHPYIVIERPGYYGAEGRIYSRHRTLAAAARAARRRVYTDEHGCHRCLAVVAHNLHDRYRAGDTFYADAPPRTVPSSED